MPDRPGFDALRRHGAPEATPPRSATEDRSIIAEVDRILGEAAAARATEIHFEPSPEGLVVRVRQDGSLHLAAELPEATKMNVTNRLKVMGQMDITKTRTPQSGFFKRALGDRKVECYVHTMPTLHGEAAVIRISDVASVSLRLDDLGMNEKVLQVYRRCLARGSGLTLISGPPGSGKRTTVYASIVEILKPDQLAMGFDSIIKYEIPGMVQAKPDDKGEYTFAEAIQALMRQEPDVAYIGEITEESDARATVQGSFAKRTVLARLNANDAVNAIQNLTDMGLQPFLLAASITAIINQRLLRRLCPHCRQAYTPDDSLKEEIGYKIAPTVQFYRAGGCSECADTGYSGVLAMFELFRPSEELNKMIVAKESMQAVRSRAIKEGLLPLKWDGVRKAAAGLATLEDVLNAL